MKRVSLRISWPDGLHLRPASMLVRLARGFRSSIRIYANGRMADARSILGILLLAAASQTSLEVEAMGEDEDHAIQAVQQFFHGNSGGDGGPGGGGRG